MKLPKKLGEILYILLAPFIWFWLRQSNRVYVVVCFEESFILTQNWLGPNKKWRLPGGGIKRGESTFEAATRELKEELDIDVKATNFTPLDVKLNNFKFLRVDMPKKPNMTPKQNEIKAAEVVKFSDCNRYALDKSTRLAISNLTGANGPNLL